MELKGKMSVVGSKDAVLETQLRVVGECVLHNLLPPNWWGCLPLPPVMLLDTSGRCTVSDLRKSARSLAAWLRWMPHGLREVSRYKCWGKVFLLAAKYLCCCTCVGLGGDVRHTGKITHSRVLCRREGVSAWLGS